MMRIVIVSIFISFFFISCEKESNLNDNFQKKIIGKWNWTGSCGGFTDECWYPSENNYKQVEFSNFMRYNEKENGSLVMKCQYQLLDTFLNGQTIIYKISFKNYYETFLWFTDNKLNIQGGDFVEEYESE